MNSLSVNDFLKCKYCVANMESPHFNSHMIINTMYSYFGESFMACCVETYTKISSRQRLRNPSRRPLLLKDVTFTESKIFICIIASRPFAN
jgi:hypothetical protein